MQDLQVFNNALVKRLKDRGCVSKRNSKVIALRVLDCTMSIAVKKALAKLSSSAYASFHRYASTTSQTIPVSSMLESWLQSLLASFKCL